MSKTFLVSTIRGLNVYILGPWLLQIYALCEVFHKLYKWCIHTSLGYEKRAKHDVLVPKEMYHTTYAQIKAKYAETIIRWVKGAEVF